MDFRAYLRKRADDSMGGDLAGYNSMDPTGLGDVSNTDHRTDYQPDPETDGQDPATPGGASPFNAAEPLSEPVSSDPECLDPQGDKPHTFSPMPHATGPDMDTTTLHGASLGATAKAWGSTLLAATPTDQRPRNSAELTEFLDGAAEAQGYPSWTRLAAAMNQESEPVPSLHELRREFYEQATARRSR
jgi:hypothetical protein